MQSCLLIFFLYIKTRVWLTRRKKTNNTSGQCQCETMWRKCNTENIQNEVKRTTKVSHKTNGKDAHVVPIPRRWGRPQHTMGAFLPMKIYRTICHTMRNIIYFLCALAKVHWCYCELCWRCFSYHCYYCFCGLLSLLSLLFRLTRFLAFSLLPCSDNLLSCLFGMWYPYRGWESHLHCCCDIFRTSCVVSTTQYTYTYIFWMKIYLLYYFTTSCEWLTRISTQFNSGNQF